MIAQKEKQNYWRNPQLDMTLMQAYHVNYAYPKHSHDQYVICLIEHGVQSFTLKGTKYITTPGRLILINPGVVHTGEAATEKGFHLRSLYPSVAHMRAAVYELTGCDQGTPFFNDLHVDDPAVTRSVYDLHIALTHGAGELENESRFVSTLAQLIKRYGEIKAVEQPLGNESTSVKQARDYINEHYAQSVSLTQLADYVGLSRYYFLRVFQQEIGMPPHAYLQDVRIRRTKQLIEQGRPLSDIAFSVGFSSQSHMTRRFKQFVGITPGKYAHCLGLRFQTRVV